MRQGIGWIDDVRALVDRTWRAAQDGLGERRRQPAEEARSCGHPARRWAWDGTPVDRGARPPA